MSNEPENIIQTVEKIKPSARLISTIGKELIKDVYAAVVELVKNAYDADSEVVEILIEYNKEIKLLKVAVTDQGHGMSLQTITDIWLVPATSDKLYRRTSPKGRILQGRKGIGRYAAGILGSTLLLESTDEELNLSKIIIDFDELEKSKYLADVDILVESGRKNATSGVYIEATSSNLSVEDVAEIWDEKQRKKLEIELRKLKSPLIKNVDDTFDIKLVFNNIPKIEENKKDKDNKTINFISEIIEIKPLPILDSYDYRISGYIDEHGNGNLTYENQNLTNTIAEIIPVHIELGKSQLYCGKIEIDFRVFDRDALDEVISRGLEDSIKKSEVKKLLNDLYGIGIYRDIFRIRPYGDQDYDWLDLDKDRVQNPVSIGLNQVVGFINIQSEELSGLHEKSARDGLKENAHYFGLKKIAKEILSKILQPRRYIYRQNVGRGRKVKNINETLDSLFDFESMEAKVKSQLSALNVTDEATAKIIDIIATEKKQKETALLEIKNTIAVYQGQVTLGKLTEVLLHEGRKPLKYINEQLPRINRLIDKYTVNPNQELKQDILEKSTQTVSQAKAISLLFKRIEPLSRGRIPNKKVTNIYQAIQQASLIFESSLEDNKIRFINEIDPSIAIFGREYDLITAFSNFFENSVYWLTQSNKSERIIEVSSELDENIIRIELKDNGPGIPENFAQNVFDPGFSLKDGGTGLGLSIAAEALKRSDGTVSIGKSINGAKLYIEFPKGNSNA